MALELGSSLTTIGIGGPVDLLVRPKTEVELQDFLAAKHPLVRCLGGGSNLVLADEGFRGALLQPHLSGIELVAEVADPSHLRAATAYYAAKPGEQNLELRQQVQTGGGEPVLVRMGSGVPWGQAVTWSLRQNLVGLHWYARIPCRIGGAVVNNIHGERHLLSEVVYRVESLDLATGEQHLRYPAELRFGYDQSLFQQVGEVVTAVTLCLQRVADATPYFEQYRDWTASKAKVQPSGKNCGSVFQNLPPERAVAGHLAAGWYVDQCGWRGRSFGDLQVHPAHANFIVNRGSASQAEFIQLVEQIRTSVADRFGFLLEPEVECWDQQGKRRAWQS